MKKRTLTLMNKLLALLMVSLGITACKTRMAKVQPLEEKTVVSEPIRCLYGPPPARFIPKDTVQEPTVEEPIDTIVMPVNPAPADTIRRRPRPRPGQIVALYGVYPTEFEPLEKE